MTENEFKLYGGSLDTRTPGPKKLENLKVKHNHLGEDEDVREDK